MYSAKRNLSKNLHKKCLPGPVNSPQSRPPQRHPQKRNMQKITAFVLVLAVLVATCHPVMAKKSKKGPKITHKVYFDISIGGKDAGACSTFSSSCPLPPKHSWCTRRHRARVLLLRIKFQSVCDAAVRLAVHKPPLMAPRPRARGCFLFCERGKRLRSFMFAAHVAWSSSSVTLTAGASALSASNPLACFTVVMSLG